MTYDYIIIGATLESYILAQKLIKLNYKCIIIEKKNKQDYFDSFNQIKSNIFFSSNDVNFLNFLNENTIDFKTIGTLYNFNFKFTEILSVLELKLLYNEIIKISLYDESSKDIKFMNFLDSNNFSNDSIEYINNFCLFFDKKINIITLYDFINLLNCKLFCDYYILNYKTLFTELLNKNKDIEINFDSELIEYTINNNKIDNVKINNFSIRDNFKYIFCISIKNIKKIEQNINYDYDYDYLITLKWNQNLIIPENLKTDLKYFNLIEYNTILILNNHKIDIQNTKNKLFFITKPETIFIYKKYLLSNNLIYDNCIILKNNKNIEDDVINTLYNLYKININYKKMFKIYKNDSLSDIIKLYIFINLYLILFQKIKCIV